MKNAFLILSAAMVLFLAACAKKEPEASGTKPAEKPAEKTADKGPESRVSHGTNGEIFVTLNAETQKAMGLQVAELPASESNDEVKGYAHVLDASTLATASADLITAEAASAASQAELSRLQKLAAQSNTSERALQTAAAAAARDQAQLDAAKLKLAAFWGRGLTERKDLPALIKALSGQESALVQVEVPLGTEIKAAPETIRLANLEGQAVSGRFVGPAAAVTPQFQNRGFIYLVETNSMGLAPGANLSAFLPVPGKAKNGVEIPREAIVRRNGDGWVYVQREPEKFERVAVPLEKLLPKGWFVPEILKAGDKVVVQAAQQLLSEEQKGGGVD
jgi:hypothetical protein